MSILYIVLLYLLYMSLLWEVHPYMTDISEYLHVLYTDCNVMADNYAMYTSTRTLRF